MSYTALPVHIGTEPALLRNPCYHPSVSSGKAKEDVTLRDAYKMILDSLGKGGQSKGYIIPRHRTDLPGNSREDHKLGAVSCPE